MKRLLLILGLLLCAGPCWAQTFVKCTKATATSATSVTVNPANTAGNFLAFGTREGVNATSTVTIVDSASQTWTQTVSGYEAASGNAARIGMWIMPNSAALTSLQITWSGGLSTNIDIVVCEASGMATSSAEDTSVNATQTAGTTATSGSYTTTNAADILFMYVGLGSGYSLPVHGTGWTIPTNGDSGLRSVMQYKINSATEGPTTGTMTWTGSVINENVLGAFKASGGATCTICAGIGGAAGLGGKAGIGD